VGETGERISVLCSCGKTLKAPASAVGKKAKCPKCGTVLTVQAPPPPPPPPPHAQPDSIDDALYDLADQSQQAAAQAPPPLGPRCPQCMAEMAAGAVLCTRCGYDTRTGKSLRPSVQKAAPGKKSKKETVDKMAPQASFFKGLAASFGGALIGGIIWFLIAWGTGYELYFIALLVGALAGIGMQWGQQGYSYLGGFAAAGVTLVVMILAKVAVVAAVLLPIMRAEDAADGDGEFDERVVDMLVEEHFKSRNIDPDEVSFDQHEAALRAVGKKLKKMPRQEYEALLAKVQEDETQEELVEYVTDEVLKNTMQVNPDDASDAQRVVAEKQAQKKVAAMTPAQRAAEHKRLTALAEAQAAKELAELEKALADEEDADGEGDKPSRGRSAAAAIGFVVILLLMFGWKSIIFMLGALFIAYRTASGSVHG
jgi:hypothetical protein